MAMSETAWVSAAELQEAQVLLVEDGNHGEYRPRQDDFTSDPGWAYIRAADLDRGRIDFKHAAKITDESQSRLRKGIGRPLDVLLSHKGTVGKVALAPQDSPRFVCSPQTTFWRSLQPGTLDPTYLSYYLRSRAFTLQLDARKGETDMADYVSLSEQRRLLVAMPPIVEQRHVVSILSALDQLMVTRGVQAELSDNLVCALLDRELASSSVNSCPPGWTLRPLSSLARFVNGGAHTRDASGTGRMVVRIAEMNGGPSRSTVYSDREVSDDQSVRPGDLLFSWSGSLVVQRWYRDEAIVNQHIFKVVPGAAPAWLLYAYITMLMPGFLGIVRDKATTMGHLQRHHLDVAVPFPDPEHLRALSELGEAAWGSALTAEREVLVLSNLHDVLLADLVGSTPSPTGPGARFGR
jgi:type I restriction enzyme S subunit